MNQDEFAAFMDRIYETEIKAVRADGQKEYAHEGESFDANFRRIGDRLDMEPAMVLFVYLSKHMDGIASFLKGHTSQREDVTGRIKDAITYLFLLWGIIEDERTLIPARDLKREEDWARRVREAELSPAAEEAMQRVHRRMIDADDEAFVDEIISNAPSPSDLHLRGREFIRRMKGGHIDDPVPVDEDTSETAERARSAADEIDDWAEVDNRQVERAGGLGLPMRWLFGHDGMGMGG